MNEFQWLLVLGFPAEIAAATIAPDTFLADDVSGFPSVGRLVVA